MDTVRPMLSCYRYDSIAAGQAGETQSPDIAIRVLVPDAKGVERAPTGGCWHFYSEPLDYPPSYVRLDEEWKPTPGQTAQGEG